MQARAPAPAPPPKVCPPPFRLGNLERFSRPTRLHWYTCVPHVPRGSHAASQVQNEQQPLPQMQLLKRACNGCGNRIQKYVVNSKS